MAPAMTPPGTTDELATLLTTSIERMTHRPHEPCAFHMQIVNSTNARLFQDLSAEWFRFVRWAVPAVSLSDVDPGRAPGPEGILWLDQAIQTAITRASERATLSTYALGLTVGRLLAGTASYVEQHGPIPAIPSLPAQHTIAAMLNSGGRYYGVAVDRARRATTAQETNEQ